MGGHQKPIKSPPKTHSIELKCTGPTIIPGISIYSRMIPTTTTSRVLVDTIISLRLGEIAFEMGAESLVLL